MKLCLLNPPDLNSLDAKLDPPLGLMGLSSFLKEKGVDTTLIDLTWENDWKKVIEDNLSDLYGLTVYSASLDTSIKISNMIKTIHPTSKTIVGGPHFTALPWELARNPFDFVCMGEGEETLLELTQKWGNEYLYSSIVGLGYKSRGIYQGREVDQLFLSNQRPLMEDLNVLPIPDRDSVPIKSYTRTVEGVQSCAVMLSRGCYGSCAFCNSPNFWQRKVRMRSVIKSLEELITIVDNYGFKAVHFWDDILTLKGERFDLLMKGIKNLNIIFRANGDPRLDTPETLKKLLDAGCREYCLGIESGSPKILDKIHKGTNPEKMKAIILEAKRIGLPVKTYLMVGHPGETWEDVEMTLQFVKDTEPDFWTLFNFIPLPGCEIWNKAEEYGIKLRTQDWKQYFCIGGENIGGITHDVIGGLSGEEIEEARQYLLANFPPQRGYLQDYYKREKIE